MYGLLGPFKPPRAYMFQPTAWRHVCRMKIVENIATSRARRFVIRACSIVGSFEDNMSPGIVAMFHFIPGRGPIAERSSRRNCTPTHVKSISFMFLCAAPRLTRGLRVPLHCSKKKSQGDICVKVFQCLSRRQRIRVPVPGVITQVCKHGFCGPGI